MKFKRLSAPMWTGLHGYSLKRGSCHRCWPVSAEDFFLPVPWLFISSTLIPRPSWRREIQWKVRTDLVSEIEFEMNKLCSSKIRQASTIQNLLVFDFAGVCLTFCAENLTSKSPYFRWKSEVGIQQYRLIPHDDAIEVRHSLRFCLHLDAYGY